MGWTFHHPLCGIFPPLIFLVYSPPSWRGSVGYGFCFWGKPRAAISYSLEG